MVGCSRWWVGAGWFGVDLDGRWIGFRVFALFWIVFVLVSGRFVLARDGLR